MPSQQLQIGPPHSSLCEGMQRTYRRQQLPPNSFHTLRNVRISKEAIERIGGRVRLLAGARTSKSLSFHGNANSWVTIPYTDTAAITDYNLDTRGTIYVAWKPDDLADDILLASASSGANPAWRLVQNTNGTLTGTFYDGTTTATLTTTSTYSSALRHQAWLVRNGANSWLYVNDDDPITDTSLSATASLGTTGQDIKLSGWTGRASGSEVTFYEFRLFRTAETSKDWRLTQYPWTGRFGDANLICHLVFEEASGTSITDYSRVNNASIAITGADLTWNSDSLHQTVTPVTGLYLMENARGRKWLLADIGPNHYRIPLN